MAKVVTVKNVKFGEGMPKIAIPISDSDFTGVRKSVNLIWLNGERIFMIM